MDVDVPAAEGERVGVAGRGLEVGLGEDMVAEDAAGFALVGPEADEVEPISGGFGAVCALILDVVPDAEELTEGFVADLFVVVDLVEGEADFDPPVAAFELGVVAAGEVLFGGELGGPLGGAEGDGAADVAGAEEERVTHLGLGGGGFGGDGFVVGGAGFHAPAVVGTGAVAEDAISCGINEERSGDQVLLFGAELVGVDAEDGAGVAHFHFAHGGIEEEGDVGFADDPFVEHQVPDGVHEAFDVGLVVADAFFDVELFEDAGFLAPDVVVGGDLRVEADFAGGVATEHGAFVDEGDADAVAGGGDGGAGAGDAAADDGEVELVGFGDLLAGADVAAHCTGLGLQLGSGEPGGEGFKDCPATEEHLAIVYRLPSADKIPE